MIKLLILSSLAMISYQDIKERQVYAFVFLVLIGLLGYIHHQHTLQIHFLYALLINTTVLIIIMAMLYLYTLLRLKRSFFEEVFGLGDVLFFLALAVGFPTVSFIIILVFALLFSLAIWIFFKKSAKYPTVPLAGYMSLFLGVVFVTNWTTNVISLYLI
ncbi:prepilin peptidase [Aquimarina algicola]|uniref:prepilin peptidase n=1 Tax=Aquimarina algicola TaxID=2589995 RepID=UPI001CF4B565|nr:prepilin peptidase [Aquimarina algicola]